MTSHPLTKMKPLVFSSCIQGITDDVSVTGRFDYLDGFIFEGRMSATAAVLAPVTDGVGFTGEIRYDMGKEGGVEVDGLVWPSSLSQASNSKCSSYWVRGIAATLSPMYLRFIILYRLLSRSSLAVNLSLHPQRSSTIDASKPTPHTNEFMPKPVMPRMVRPASSSQCRKPNKMVLSSTRQNGRGSTKPEFPRALELLNRSVKTTQ